MSHQRSFGVKPNASDAVQPDSQLLPGAKAPRKCAEVKKPSRGAQATLVKALLAGRGSSPMTCCCSLVPFVTTGPRVIETIGDCAGSLTLLSPAVNTPRVVASV